MKKIYMILAAMTLLSMSLNAQLLPENQRFKAENNPTPVTQLKDGHHLSVFSASSNQGMGLRAPKKVLNAGECYVGPYTTDDFSTNGVSFASAYTSAQSINLNVILDRSEFENHIGDKILGFRFALAGSGVVPVWSFNAKPYTISGSSINWDTNQYEWELGSMHGDGYVKVTDINDITDDGEYLIVCENNSVAFNGGLTTLDATGNTIPVTINSDGTIDASSTVNAATFYIEYYNGYYYIQSNSGYYIGRSANSNGLSTAASLTTNTQLRNFRNSISIDSNGNATISSYSSYYLRFNNTSGQNRFRYFSSSTQYQNIQIYKRIGASVVFLNGGQWYEYRLDEPITFDVSSGTENMLIGYTFYQPLSNDLNYNTAPVAVNPNSTTHDHMALMYASSDGSNYQRSWWLLGNINGDLAVQLIFEESAPKLITPENGSTVNVGTIEGGSSVSTTITVSGQNLTENLNVSVSGTGFTVTPATLSAADVNDGTATVTVTYSGTDPSATGTLTIGSSEASTTVNLTASYIDTTPVLIVPTDGSTVNVGTNTGAGVSTTITVDGNYLTENLTVTVSGSGFSVSPTTISAADANAGTTITVTYDGTTLATGTLTISSGEVSTTVTLTGSYSTGIAPVVHGMVRMGTLPIVDQFAEKIPATNDHPYRYTYYLKLATRDTTSSPARVPAQHTGAVLQGYYTIDEMDNDTDPDNFLKENMLSAEVDLNLSPSSAPYYYTINSVKNGVPTKADDYDSYISVLQRRSLGDYQEMYKPDAASGFTGYTGQIHPSGEYDFFDFRAITAEQLSDSLSYVPIVWTNGIARHYFTTDSLNNSYGAPLWINRIGSVNIVTSQIERQANVKPNGDVVWNPSVNWYNADSTQAYSLYMISDLQAEGILPNCNVDYEPYMFRLWLVDSTYSLRGYRWENLGQPGQHIVDDPDSTPEGAWLLLDTKMCENYQMVNGVSTYVPDLVYVISKVDGDLPGNSWEDNIMFGAKISSNFKPRLVVRFYYKEKARQQLTPVEPEEPSGLRGNRAGDDDHVGYVVLRGTNPNDPGTAIHEIVATGEVVSRTYYNTMGMESDKPFDGVNIVITRYSDGTTSTSKVLY